MDTDQIGAVSAGSPPRPAPGGAAFVRVESVVKRYGGTTALAGVSLDVARGAFFALLGPSGCGKTTLLRLLAGFEAPDEGRIFIDGAEMTSVPPYERPVNTMFQSYALFPHLSVERNVAFGLKQEGLATPEIRERVAEALRLVEMDAFADRRPDRLSGGQRQRVALARALVKRPKLLLLDEPMAALDAKLRERTRAELVAIQAKVGITFIVVTHDQEEAMTMASTVAVLEAGRVCQVGAPRDVYETPRSRFVADFIGAVNLLEGRVRAVQDGWAEMALGGGDVVLRAAAPVGLQEGRAVFLAVRPEKIEAGAEPPVGGGNRLRGHVAWVAYHGGHSILHVDLLQGGTARVAVPNASRVEAPAFRPGDPLWLRFAPESALLLTE